MDEFLHRLGGTLVNRPYVFAFLAGYLVVAWQQLGWRRALAFIPVGYLIAWASEKASITTGFPYGWYYYKYENLQHDLLVAGVPFFDSLSYVFLSYVGWSMAITLLAPLRRAGRGIGNVHWTGEARLRRRPTVILLGAFLTMLLDVVIDPIAHKGDEWFLGSIYGYGVAGAPVHGEYFDILVSNFAGWFLVALAIITAYALVDRLLARPGEGTGARDRHGDGGYGAGLIGAALFYGILAFNLVMILVVALQRAVADNTDGALTMAALFACSLGWHLPVAIKLWLRVRSTRTNGDSSDTAPAGPPDGIQT